MLTVTGAPGHHPIDGETTFDQFKASLGNTYARGVLGFTMNQAEANWVLSSDTIAHAYYTKWRADPLTVKQADSRVTPPVADKAAWAAGPSRTIATAGLTPAWFTDPSGAPRIPTTSQFQSDDLTFGRAVTTVFAKYAQFGGIARRSEYWWWYLFVNLVGVGTLLIDSFATFGALTALWLLSTIVPSLAVAVRRLRDTGVAWPVLLLSFVPFGGLVLVIFLCQPSQTASLVRRLS
ncbi:DUF805 domain-containing protein [Cryobacterium sp. TMT2-18-3]|uniref:DUF805 domain-containing protein n=1 Tax=unclassified Cryobacterium TaxID=2649013 RepID=UPI0010696FBC|nr:MULTISPECIES: DUF805 domain-containing protein [unclassified Cryobacterium]TFC26427.1 DUF805 domain-containing protein [Cryobacterium sp. TMT2-18-2]TFC64395.1 DUF805 domain-containing protein [Cryobacterium sp. TMT2-18-3]